MRKLNVVQFGMRHEHASGKIDTLKKMGDLIDIVGVVDDASSTTPMFPGALSHFDNIPRLTEEQVFARKDIDFVLVEVPNLDLVPLARKCAEHNLPMHLDKPAGYDLDGYKDVLELCKAKNLPLQMGYMFRGNPVFKYLDTLVKGGVLGELFEADMDMNHSYGSPTYQDYVASLKGGVMFNLGCHLIDYVVTLLGGKPERVESFLQSTPEVNAGTLNNTLAIMQYKYATAVVRICAPTDRFTHQRHMRLAGTNGYAEFCPLERFDGQSLVLTVALKEGRGGLPAGKTVINFPPVRDRYIDQLTELVEIVRGDRPNPDYYEHDYDVHKITLAASGFFPWSK